MLFILISRIFYILMRNILAIFLYFDKKYFSHFFICDMGFSTNILTIFWYGGDYYFG